MKAEDVIAKMSEPIEELLLTVMNELEPLIHLLEGKYGWLPGFITWVGALRLAAKFVSTHLQEAMTRIVQAKADPELLTAVLNNRAYRLTAFLIDLFASVKLPNAKDL